MYVYIWWVRCGAADACTSSFPPSSASAWRSPWTPNPKPYRVTSPTRNPSLPGPYRRLMPRVLGFFEEGGQVQVVIPPELGLCMEVTSFFLCITL